jgi:hypothetical protein
VPVVDRSHDDEQRQAENMAPSTVTRLDSAAAGCPAAAAVFVRAGRDFSIANRGGSF